MRGGYRRPHSTFSTALISVARWNNETVNFWTHFIPFLGCVAYSINTFPSSLLLPGAIPPRYYPLLAVESSICLYLLFSSLAHMFNCMSPPIRHVCFFLDYAAISVFGIGGACSVFYYQRPVHGGILLFNFVSVPEIFMPLAAFTSCSVCFITCASRHRWDAQKYVIRTVAFACAYAIDHLPSGERTVKCYTMGQECSNALQYTMLTWLFYLLSAVFNAGRIPERWRPGMFDYIGHSHHWVHVMTTMGTLCHLKAVIIDLRERESVLSLDKITFTSSLGWVVGTMLTCILIVAWFGLQLTPSGKRRHQNQKTE